jgi:hypothetical protein
VSQNAYYMDGTEVREGDIVAISQIRLGARGVVLKVLLPGTPDAAAWAVPEGGVLLKGDVDGLFVTSALADDEDIVFVRRGGDEPGDP